jgi:hypothetical protein
VLKIADLVGERLEVHGPGFFGKPGLLELRAGDLVAVTLRHTLAGLGPATATSADGEWEFESRGVWPGRVTVRTPESKSEVSVFRYDPGLALFGIPVFGSAPSGTFLGIDGREYTASWDRFNDFDLRVANAAGETVVSYTQDRSSESPVAQVQISRSASTIEGLPWMVMLGLFLQVAARSGAASGYGPH